MNFKEKKIAYDNLKGEQYFEADLSLLKEKAPGNEWCKKKIFHPAKAQAEILWILLDLVTKEDVITNRREILKKKEPEKVKELAAENEDLKAEIESKHEEVADLESEKEDLRDENDELQEQVEKLEQDMVEEKKSQPVTKVPAKSKKKTSTRKSPGKTSKGSKSSKPQ